MTQSSAKMDLAAQNKIITLVFICMMSSIIFAIIRYAYSSRATLDDRVTETLLKIFDESKLEPKDKFFDPYIEICRGNKLMRFLCVKRTEHFNISQLSELAGTDEYWKEANRSTLHYFEAYDQLFSTNLRQERMTLIEVGISVGSSLRFWQRVFPIAQIVGVDKQIKDVHLPFTIHAIEGDMKNVTLIKDLCKRYRDIKIVIDDAEESVEDSVFFFQKIFPCLIKGGIYIIEDVLWKVSKNATNKKQEKLKFFANMTYGVQEQYSASLSHQSSSYGNKLHEMIFSVHFFPNLIAIQKRK